MGKECLHSANVQVILLFISTEHVNLEQASSENVFVTFVQLRCGNAKMNWHGHKKSYLDVENN